MNIMVDGVAEVRVSGTQKIIRIQSSDLDWSESDHGDREMGKEIAHTAEYTDDQIGTISWIIYEYPEGAINDIDHQFGGHELVKDFKFSLGAEI